LVRISEEAESGSRPPPNREEEVKTRTRGDIFRVGRQRGLSGHCVERPDLVVTGQTKKTGGDGWRPHCREHFMEGGRGKEEPCWGNRDKNRNRRDGKDKVKGSFGVRSRETHAGHQGRGKPADGESRRVQKVVGRKKG